jgi:hypothetical protein
LSSSIPFIFFSKERKPKALDSFNKGNLLNQKPTNFLPPNCYRTIKIIMH